MTKFLYVLVSILSALVTVWCSLSWTLCIAYFLGLSLLLLLLQQGGGVQVRQNEDKWPDDNDTTVKIKHKDNNTTVDQEDKNFYEGHSYLKRKNSVNRSRNHSQSLGSDSEDEDIPGSVSNNTRTTLLSMMSDLEKSISNSRLLSLFSVFNKKSNGENNRPASSPGRYNNGDKNGRQTLKGNHRRRMAVGGDGTSHMSPSTPAGSRISRMDNSGIIGSPLSSPYRGRITGYDRGRTVRKSGNPSYSHQRQGRFASPVVPSSPLSTTPLPRFHRTACESPDRPGINPVGFTPHTLQRPEVCYPSNSSPGILPHVRLEKRIKIPLVESNINKMRSPVTVRIAPPETGVIHSPKFTSLKQNLDFPMTPDTSDVLSALREGTRKRSNVAGSDDDSIFESTNNTAKRRRQESNHSTVSSSSMPSLPDFLPDLSLCNFTPSSYMSPTSRFMIASSAASSSGSVTNPSSGVVAGSSGTNTGVKRPVAPCAHLSQVDNSPNSKRPRQEMKNNPIFSSLSSSQRYRLHQKETAKRKIPDSTEPQDPVASKENQETVSSDNEESEKPTSKANKLNRSVTETPNSKTDSTQTPGSTTVADRQSEDTQASTSANESKTADLRSRRKHLSFTTPGINLDRLSYANVYATKQDYENDRKAEQERVEKMLDRIATDNKAPDTDLLSEKNVVGSSEETSQTTLVLTFPSTTISSNSKALTCTTAATSLIVSSTTASLTSSSSLPVTKANTESTSSTSASSSTPAVSSILSSTTASTAPPTTATTMLPSTSTLSSLLQSSTSPNTLVTSSSSTSSITVSQTTTDLSSTSTKPTETTTSLTSTSTPSTVTSASAFQPMFGSAATTSAQSPSKGGFQFEIKTSSVPSSIPSTTSSVVTPVTTTGFSLGTFSTESTTGATTALTSTTSSFMFGAGAATSPTSAFTTGATTTTTNAGSLLFSSPSKDPPSSGGFSFTIVSPHSTSTSSATQKTDSQQVSSPFGTPKTQLSSASSSSLFSFAASSTQTSTATHSTATTTSSSLTFGTAATAATPAPGVFTFGKSPTPASLPQSSTPATSNIPTPFTFKPNDAAKTSSASVPTSNPTNMFTFKEAANSTSTVTNPTPNELGFVFGSRATSTNLPAFGSSAKAPPAYGTTTSAGTFGSASSKFGLTLASSTPAFGTTSTSTSAPTPSFGSTTLAPSPAFGATTAAPTPAFGATTMAPTPAFGTTTVAPTPAFGVTSAAPTPTFGSTTAAPKPAFGAASTTSTPIFGASSSTTTPAFASPTSAASPLFGSNKPRTAFGAASSPFGTSSTASTVFGSSTTAFGAPSSASSLFGASTNQSTQANTSSTGSFSFDSNSNPIRQTSTTSASSAGFNFTFNSTPASQNAFNFGTSSNNSTKSATGTTVTTTAATGSTSVFGQTASTFGGFSAAGQDGQKSMFGSPCTNQSGNFNFSGSSTNPTTNVFGQTGQQAQTSIFQNSDQPETNQPFNFGQGTTSGNTSTPFGQSSAFSSPQASSFGSFGTKPNVFATPTNNSDKPSQSAPNIFGSTPVTVASPNVTAPPKPLFGQVASTPFGGNATTPSNTGNTGLFGATPTGQASTPAGGSTAPGIFTFGQSSGAQQPTANPSQAFDFSASLGGTSQFNFGQGGTTSKPPMFNMGSGSTAPKMRSFYSKTRRRGAKK